jgi:chromatin remodeling complex protein RSC6
MDPCYHFRTRSINQTARSTIATNKKSGAKNNVANKSAPKKSSAKKGGAKKATRKSATKKRSGAKRTPNAAFMKAMQPSSQLAAVVGNKPMPRTEITKKLWAYIKKHDLQDAKERRMINADDKLSKVFGGKKQVSMFEMTKLVSKHVK